MCKCVDNTEISIQYFSLYLDMLYKSFIRQFTQCANVNILHYVSLALNSNSVFFKTDRFSIFKNFDIILSYSYKGI